MLTFNYVARDTTTNKTAKGTLQAESEREAAKLLMDQRLIPTSIKADSETNSFLAKIKNPITTKDRVVFTRQLATLINAGLPLAQSLRTVQEQTQNKKLKLIAQEILSNVEGGNSLADSFKKHDVFDELFVALVAAGEISGTLDKSLERIADQQEKDAEMMSKVKGALVYPAIVVTIILLVIVFMLTTVMPQVETLYKGMNKTLPFISLIMVGAGHFVATFWWAMLIALGVGIFLLTRYVKTDEGIKQLDTLKLNMPMFKKLFRKLYMARFMRTGETLLASGVPMLEMMRIAGSSMGNVVVQQGIFRASEKVRAGKSLSFALKNEVYVLSLVPQMLSIGEQSGQIDSMMGKAATFYENEVDEAIKALSAAMEPVLMVMLALVAGLMVGAILLPIYGLSGSSGLGG